MLIEFFSSFKQSLQTVDDDDDGDGCGSGDGQVFVGVSPFSLKVLKENPRRKKNQQ